MNEKRLQDLGHAAALGFSFVFFVLAFAGLGYGLDCFLGIRPWLLVAGVFTGAACGLVYVIRVLCGSDQKGPQRAGAEEGLVVERPEEEGRGGTC